MRSLAVTRVALAAGLILASSSVILAEDAVEKDMPESAAASTVEPKTIILPMADALRGKRLFVTKGCVLCHAINGAGGIAAPALDAGEGSEQLDLMAFVVRMWNGAQAMIELQAFELGYQIDLTGEEITDLAAFAASPDAQRGFSLQDVPEAMRSWIIQKPYWMGDGWPENFEQEYHEDGLPLDYD